MADREVVVVTGGASGFGLAFGTECVARGMDVVLLDRDEGRVQTEATAIGAVAIGVDVTEGDDMEAAAGAVEERFGRADVVLSNVGVQLFGAVETFTDDEWRWLLDVNVVGAARTTRAFLPLLRRAERARLAFTTSTSVLEPAARLGAYQASKFAVWGLAETLRLELAGEVEVTVVFPSGMMSRHLESSADAQPDHLRRDVVTDEDLDAMLASTPTMASAIATPEDAAGPAVDAVLSGAPYVITHGDLTAPLATRTDAIRRAAEQARDR